MAESAIGPASAGDGPQIGKYSGATLAATATATATAA